MMLYLKRCLARLLPILIIFVFSVSTSYAQTKATTVSDTNLKSTCYDLLKTEVISQTGGKSASLNFPADYSEFQTKSTKDKTSRSMVINFLGDPFYWKHLGVGKSFNFGWLDAFPLFGAMKAEKNRTINTAEIAFASLTEENPDQQNFLYCHARIFDIVKPGATVANLKAEDFGMMVPPTSVSLETVEVNSQKFKKVITKGSILYSDQATTLINGTRIFIIPESKNKNYNPYILADYFKGAIETYNNEFLPRALKLLNSTPPGAESAFQVVYTDRNGIKTVFAKSGFSVFGFAPTFTNGRSTAFNFGRLHHYLITKAMLQTGQKMVDRVWLPWNGGTPKERGIKSFTESLSVAVKDQTPKDVDEETFKPRILIIDKADKMVRMTQVEDVYQAEKKTKKPVTRQPPSSETTKMFWAIQQIKKRNNVTDSIAVNENYLNELDNYIDSVPKRLAAAKNRSRTATSLNQTQSEKRSIRIQDIIPAFIIVAILAAFFYIGWLVIRRK